MRELGEGIRRMFEAMEQNDLEKPQLVSSGTFSVVLSNRSVFNQREEDWLAMFNSFEDYRDYRNGSSSQELTVRNCIRKIYIAQ